MGIRARLMMKEEMSEQNITLLLCTFSLLLLRQFMFIPPSSIIHTHYTHILTLKSFSVEVYMQYIKNQKFPIIHVHSSNYSCTKGESDECLQY